MDRADHRAVSEFIANIANNVGTPVARELCMTMASSDLKSLSKDDKQDKWKGGDPLTGTCFSPGAWVEKGVSPEGSFRATGLFPRAPRAPLVKGSMFFD